MCAAESLGAIMTGWVHETFVESKFTFTFIGLEWLNILHGEWMNGYFAVMGAAGLMIMLGWYYRISAFTFFIMWAGVYFAQKSHYNNHYYLLMVMSFVMFLLPAHKSYSVDVKLGRTKKEDTCPRVAIFYFIIQVGIIYVFASMHKLYPDWLAVKPFDVWFKSKSDYWLIGPLLQETWFKYFIAYGGIIYDGSIVFLLLFKRTRLVAFILSIVFNLSNSAIFQIGIFPYLMIALSMLFFEPDQIRKIFFRKKTQVEPVNKMLPLPITYALITYFVISIMVPLRHHLFPGDAHFTEEGHRLAWRMMLRAKTSHAAVTVMDKATGTEEIVDLDQYLSPLQKRKIGGYPDMLWSLAQRIKEDYKRNGKEVSVFVNASVSLNGRPYQALIDKETDLAAVKWERFKHSDWILTPDLYD